MQQDPRQSLALTYEPKTTIIRGRPLRTIVTLGSAMLIGLLIFPAAQHGLSHTGLSRRDVVLWVFLTVIAAVIVLLCAIATALTTARYDGTHVRFTFCGLPTGSIPLHELTGFERTRSGLFSRGALILHRGKRKYLLNGLHDHNAIESLLRALNIPEKSRH